MVLQFGASLTDDTRSINYDRNTFIIQATGVNAVKSFFVANKEVANRQATDIHHINVGK